MKVLVISGFLGAGKTTFIKELANRTGRDIAIFENEYAAEGVDSTILEEGITNGEVDILEVSKGCICCSAKGDFTESVLTIANSVDPEILIVEPTGVGKLSNVLGNISRIEYDRIKLLAPVTIVDGKSVSRYIKDFDEIYTDQIKSASVILVSKMENAYPEEREHVKALLQKINPDAEIITDHYTQMEDKWFHSLYESARGANVTPFAVAVEAEKLPENFSLRGINIPSVKELTCFMEDLIRGEYGDIIRTKGHARINSEAVRFEAADLLYSITGVSGKADNTVVFIGHNIKRQKLRKKLFTGANAANAALRPVSDFGFTRKIRKRA